MAEEKERGLVVYQSRDGQEIRLCFDTVRKYLVSGKPTLVSDQEIVLYMGMCKARGLNPFKRDCYLVKYAEGDPAAIIVGIDYFRSRAKAQKDCVGWKSGIIVIHEDGELEYRKGSFIADGEKLVGGWFRAKPEGWDEEYEWSISLNPFIKKTSQGNVTRFWSEENQPYMITKVVESQGLRRLWPDEFEGIFTEEEEFQPRDVTQQEEPLKIPQAIAETPPPQPETESSGEPQVEDTGLPGGGDKKNVNDGQKPTEQKKLTPAEIKADILDWLENRATQEEILANKNYLTTNMKKASGLSQADQLEIVKAWNAKRKEVKIS